MNESKEKKMIPVTAAEFKNRTYVICSARTISDYKQIQVSEMEAMAATALYRKTSSKSFIHFDTISRSSIDGEWPSIILRFSDGEEFRLRHLFFAYEDREQITELFVETLKRLSAAISIAENQDIPPSDLWGKIDALMTDIVTKNLNIEDSIPLALESQHHPHLLCRSHTVEALDRSNLEVPASIGENVAKRVFLNQHRRSSLGKLLHRFSRQETY